VVDHACNPNYVESVGGMVTVQDQRGQKARLYQKIIKIKKCWGMSREVEQVQHPEFKPQYHKKKRKKVERQVS
jgi:hypothetical protein